MVQFQQEQYSVLESESNITVCINLLSGPDVILRNVSVHMVTIDGSATGMLFIRINHTRTRGKNPSNRHI